jgi:hypothetical protein
LMNVCTVFSVSPSLGLSCVIWSRFGTFRLMAPFL